MGTVANESLKVPPFGRRLMRPTELVESELEEDMRRQRALQLRALGLEPPGRRSILKFAEYHGLDVQQVQLRPFGETGPTLDPTSSDLRRESQ